MINFSIIKNPKNRPKHKCKSPALKGCPQRRAVVIKSFETTPRKPNSAKRRVAKVTLSTRYRVNIYFEGMGTNKLQPHSVVLVRGRGPRDLPGVRYHAIRGVKDFPALTNRTKGRSKYGIKRHPAADTKLGKGLHRFFQYRCRYNLKFWKGFYNQMKFIKKCIECLYHFAKGAFFSFWAVRLLGYAVFYIQEFFNNGNGWAFFYLFCAFLGYLVMMYGLFGLIPFYYKDASLAARFAIMFVVSLIMVVIWGYFVWADDTLPLSHSIELLCPRNSDCPLCYPNIYCWVHYFLDNVRFLFGDFGVFIVVGSYYLCGIWLYYNWLQGYFKRESQIQAFRENRLYFGVVSVLIFYIVISLFIWTSLIYSCVLDYSRYSDNYIKLVFLFFLCIVFVWCAVMTYIHDILPYFDKYLFSRGYIQSDQVTWWYAILVIFGVFLFVPFLYQCIFLLVYGFFVFWQFFLNSIFDPFLNLFINVQTSSFIFYFLLIFAYAQYRVMHKKIINTEAEHAAVFSETAVFVWQNPQYLVFCFLASRYFSLDYFIFNYKLVIDDLVSFVADINEFMALFTINVNVFDLVLLPICWIFIIILVGKTSHERFFIEHWIFMIFYFGFIVKLFYAQASCNSGINFLGVLDHGDLFISTEYTQIWSYAAAAKKPVDFALSFQYINSMGFVFFGDRFSMWFVFLNALLTCLCIIMLFPTWTTDKNISLYICTLLFISSCLNFVFLAADLFTFCISFESILLPMVILIGVWGSANKRQANSYLIFYTMVGAVPMLAGLIYIWAQVGWMYNLEFTSLKLFSWTWLEQYWLFIAFAIPFAIKTPMVPVHIWLPKAHVDAPTAGSVILAGLLLKIGFFGFIKFLLPVFYSAAFELLPFIASLASFGVIYSSLVNLRQIDLKRIIAYSSIAHMNMALACICLFNVLGSVAAMFVMFSHGFISSALFFLIGFIYHRFHQRIISYYGGLATVMPVFSFFLFAFSLANFAFPLTAGFVGEFLCLFSLFEGNVMLGFVNLFSLFFTTVYSMLLFSRVSFGMPKDGLRQVMQGYLVDLNAGEKWSIDLHLNELFIASILLFITLFFGIFPKFVLIDFAVELLGNFYFSFY